MSEKKIKIAFAGSTNNSLKIAKALAADKRYAICWILTPTPKKTGRKQKLVSNPLHLWAKNEAINTYLVDKKISNLNDNLDQPDYLLVVDFGYLIPEKLLNLPKKAPLNIHPSALPAWRGSSPGQFVLLSGEETSAISLIKLTKQLDAGPIVAQHQFRVQNDWKSEDYYEYSFSTAAKLVPDWIADHFQGKLVEQDQPEKSPTPLTQRISKKDAFIAWDILMSLVNKSFSKFSNELRNSLKKDTILSDFLSNQNVEDWAEVIERACRAFQPWPILWTVAPSANGEKRVQILDCELIQEENSGYLKLKEIKIEGKKSTNWNEVKNFLQKT